MANKFDAETFDENDFDELIEAESGEEEVQAPVKKKIQAPVPAKVNVQQKKREPILEEEEEEQEEEEEPVQVPAKKPVPQRQQQPQKQMSVPKEKSNRFSYYVMDKRYGILDNVTGQPYAEAGEAEVLSLALLNDILNKLDRIEESI